MKLELGKLPLQMYNSIWFWLYENDIGDMRKQAEDTCGYVDEIIMTEQEATFFTLRWL